MTSQNDSKLSYYKDRLNPSEAGKPSSTAEAHPHATPDLLSLQTALDQAKTELATLEKTFADYKEQTEKERLLALADLENARRRLQKDREDMRKYGNETLLRDLLNTLDNFELTVLHLSTAPTAKLDPSILNGITLVFKTLSSTLERFGLQELKQDTDPWPFDPNIHEAIGQKENSDYPANHVVEVLQKGYRYHDRLLRPARVMVST